MAAQRVEVAVVFEPAFLSQTIADRVLQRVQGVVQPKENLFRMPDLIDQYYVDKGQYPPSLATLVEEGYLRKLPQDPFTQGADWTPVFAEADPDRPGETPGVYDVKSTSEILSLAGTPYNEW